MNVIEDLKERYPNLSPETVTQLDILATKLSFNLKSRPRLPGWRSEVALSLVLRCGTTATACPIFNGQLGGQLRFRVELGGAGRHLGCKAQTVGSPDRTNS
jgi:hypothetical protein